MNNQTAIPYHNFDLWIDPTQMTGNYSITVAASPSGTLPAAVETILTIDTPKVQSTIAGLGNLLVSGDEVKQLSTWLADCIFGANPIFELFQRNTGHILDGLHQHLRIRLSISPNELQPLPWEYLGDMTGVPLALDERVSLVRCPRQATPLTPLNRHLPLTILVVLSNPESQRALNISKEMRNLLVALRPLLDANQVRLDLLLTGSEEDRQSITRITQNVSGVSLLPDNATTEALQDALQDGYSILHYTGHALFDAQKGGLLLLTDEAGHERLLDAETFAHLLRGRQTGLIVLNACETATEDSAQALMGMGSSLIAAEVPAVVAMQMPISDASSIAFARAFYRALANKLSVDQAVTEGRKAIVTQEEPFKWEWGKPVLYLHSPNGIVWAAQARNAQATEQPHTPSTSATFNTTLHDQSQVGQIINIESFEGELTINHKP